LSFKKIKFINFRNLVDNEINLTTPVVFFIGQNGQGKTNLIEAIYYSCYGSSFRNKSDKNVIQRTKNMCYIQSRYSIDNMERIIDIKIQDNNKKEIMVDKKKILDRKNLLENIPCILLSYNDIVYINGSPEKKRFFINQTLCLYDIFIVDLLRKYRKILLNRNCALKNYNSEIINIYDEKLAHFGLEIQIKRLELVNKINDFLTPLYKTIFNSNDELKIVYQPSWAEAKNTQEAIAHLSRNLKKDIKNMVTTSGPHRDNFYFSLNDDNFLNIASTGQIRLASLVLKIAQAKFLLCNDGKKPILLVDDVFLEIDYSKRKRILENLPDFEQAFFTILPNENLVEYDFQNRTIYYVENGKLSIWKE